MSTVELFRDASFAINPGVCLAASEPAPILLTDSPPTRTCYCLDEPTNHLDIAARE
jgi:hypothetical protein